MLTSIAGILIVLWFIGFLGFHVLGNFIHILLVIAGIAIIFRIIEGKRVL